MQKGDDKWQASVADICSFSFIPNGMVKEHPCEEQPIRKEEIAFNWPAEKPLVWSGCGSTKG